MFIYMYNNFVTSIQHKATEEATAVCTRVFKGEEESKLVCTHLCVLCMCESDDAVQVGLLCNVLYYPHFYY